METILRKIGNSRGIIIPKFLIEKYRFQNIRFEETDRGVLLVSTDKGSEFHNRIKNLQLNREKRKEMYQEAANIPDVQKYYQKVADDLGDSDLDIFE